jgi:hypothetical protein
MWDAIAWVAGGLVIGVGLCSFAFTFFISMYGPFAEYEPDNKTLLPFGVRLRHFIFGRPTKG